MPAASGRWTPCLDALDAHAYRWTVNEIVRAHVLVAGSVQGVFFRVSAADRAGRAGVKGWVRNISDGRVEAVFEGERDAVDECVTWCSSGPPGAAVDRVEVEWEMPAGEAGFRIR